MAYRKTPLNRSTALSNHLLFLDASTRCESNSNYLLYTTGTCFKYVKLIDNRIERESLREVINLTDCRASTETQLYRTFDYYFDERGLLNLVVFENRNGQLIGGQLNLNSSVFEKTKSYGTFGANTTFVVDRTTRIAYVSNGNQIESINLVDGRRERLRLHCESPDYIQLIDDRLIWLEHRDRTCFNEWSFGAQAQKRIGCVKENVQSFEIDSSTGHLYFITKDGSLFRSSLPDGSIGNHLDTILQSKLIYQPIQIKRKYQIKVFRFELIFKHSTIDLFSSDLIHQGLLHVQWSKANESMKLVPNVLFTDQPSLFDFKFIDSVQCDERRSPSPGDQTDAPIHGSIGELVDQRNDGQVHKPDSKSVEDGALKNGRIKSNDGEPLKYTKSELVDGEPLKDVELSKIVNAPNHRSNGDQSASQATETKLECTTLACSPIIYLIVFIVLAVLMILSALLAFLTKKRYNTLIADEQSSGLKSKLNNIQFNVKKAIQTM